MSAVLSKDRRIDIVSWKELHKYPKIVKNLFEKKYGSPSPSKVAINQLYDKFKKTWSVLDKPRPGRPKIARTSKSIRGVNIFFLESPSK